jgi:hypothetical protein
MQNFCCDHCFYRPEDVHFSQQYLDDNNMTNEQAVRSRFKHDIGDTLRADELFIMQTSRKIADVNDVGLVHGLTEVLSITDTKAPLPLKQVSVYTVYILVVCICDCTMFGHDLT